MTAVQHLAPLSFGLLILVGIVGIAGRLTDHSIVDSLNPPFGPMPFMTALAFVLCGGVAFAGRYVGRWWYWGGLSICMLGILGLGDALFPGKLPIDFLFVDVSMGAEIPDSLLPHVLPALAFFLGGAALCTLGITRRSHIGCLGMAGGLLSALGLGSIILDLFWQAMPYSPMIPTPLPVSTGVGFLLLGIGQVGQAWVNGREKLHRFPRWAVVSVAMMGLGIVISLWQCAVTNEHRFLRELLAKQCASVVFKLEQVITRDKLALAGFGHRWSELDGHPRGLFDADAIRYIQAQEGLMYMKIVGEGGRTIWDIHNPEFSSRVREVSLWNGTMPGQVSILAEGKDAVLHSQGVGPMPSALFITIPLENRRYLVGILDWETLLQPLVNKELSEDVYFRLLDTESRSVLYGGGREWPVEIEQWRMEIPFNLHGMPVLLDIVPHRMWVANHTGLFPLLVFMVGLMLVGVILGSFRSALKSHRKSWEHMCTAEILKNEVEMRERAQGQLTERILFIQLLLESLEEGIYGLNPEGITTFVNPAAARMLGYESGELINKPMHEMVHHSFQDGAPYPLMNCPMYLAALKGRPHHSDNEVFWKKDGTSLPVSYSSTPIMAEGGTCLGSVVVFQDISERKRYERDLQTLLDRNSEHIRQLLALTALAEELNIRRPFPDMVQFIAERMRDILGTHLVLVVCMIDDRWIQGNVGEFCFTTSWGDDGSSPSVKEPGTFPFIDDLDRPIRLMKEELAFGPAWLKTMIPFNPPRLPNGCMGVPLSNRKGTRIGGILMADKREGTFTVSDESVAVQAAQLASTAIAWQCSHEDLDRTVQERTRTLKDLNARLEKEIERGKQYEHELLCKNRDLENMLYIISHDLKEPLRTIQNFSQMVLDSGQARLESEEMNYLERVLRGGERLMHLLADIQQMARVQSLAPPSKPVSLNKLVKKAMEMLVEIIETTDAQVRVAEDLPSVAVDPLWGTQAIYNLLANALKFRKLNEPPRIEIAPFVGNEAFPEMRGVVVHDRGPGVSPKDRERIFQLFKRAVHRNVPGTGTGLAIVQQVAERHGGHAWVEEREGGGASFFLTFGPQHTFPEKEVSHA
jgi:PAS domain S-box-containing protein